MQPENNAFSPTFFDVAGKPSPVSPAPGPGLKGSLAHPKEQDLSPQNQNFPPLDQNFFPPDRVCVQCGRIISPDSVFCEYCGADQRSQPVSAAPTTPCIRCGTPLDPNDAYCYHCGASQTVQIEKTESCIHCGKPLAPDAAFCHHCGGSQTRTPRANTCRSCGTPIPEGYQYCHNCSAGGHSDGSPPFVAPVGQLNTNKGLLKTLLLSLITFGIYPLVVMSAVSNDINVVASRYDGKKTMHYCLLFFIISPLTLGIGGCVWYHKISNRIGNELRRRNIFYNFTATDYWLWSILGIFFAIGPFVYLHKLFKAVNKLNAHYNQYG